LRLFKENLTGQPLPAVFGMQFAFYFRVVTICRSSKRMAMKKRKDRRINKSLLVNISRNGMEQMGVTMNVSRRGMFIATTEAFPIDSEFQILLAAADDIFAMTGLVVWNTRMASLTEENVPAGLGIRISSADPGYYEYIAAIKKDRRLAIPAHFNC
jgi:hypothetical protein